MLVADYDAFVKESDQFADRSDEDRRDIALYGLVGEIGSLLSAVKKQLLSEAGPERWDHPNTEIIEELGDVVWYCFSLIQVTNRIPVNIFTLNIALLKHDMSASDDQSKKLQAALDHSKKDEFLEAANRFPNTDKMHFRDYQTLAFLTARTTGKTLLEVCLSVLWQLGAELMRTKLPETERELNKSVVDRETNIIVGEIGWHIAALVSLYKHTLDDIAQVNREKVSFRQKRGSPTPLHDLSEDYETAGQQIPRRFEIAFITIGVGRSRMYLDGIPLGADLTDNSYLDDGYRFHDVMHLANIAKLGWSPVVRGLMGRKRKIKPLIDEVEDGARAQLIEELIVKAIHSEGIRLATEKNANARASEQRLFPTTADVTFKLLKSIQHLAQGLEVARNKAWEWADAIVSGCAAYYELRKEGQGTVTIDLESRTLEFSPEVDIDLRGTVAGVGSALARRAQPCGSSVDDEVKILCIKHAVLDAIGYPPDDAFAAMLAVRFDSRGRAIIRARDKIEKELWKHKVITFKITTADSMDILNCTAIAMADSRDLKR